MILKPRDNEAPELQAVREHWWANRNAKEALNLLDRHDRGGNSIEHKLLVGFARNGPNDYVNSLENVIFFSNILNFESIHFVNKI